MAEDLNDYLHDQGLKVNYLHSDVETLDRIRILTGLRRGDFDILVGVNLLREGLDLPEVSLVAILDADKEGFLRSERSLVQTIGRAARNLNGKAILYADKITQSMQRAIDETKRRREKQAAFNTKNNITPAGIQKAVRDIIEADIEAARNENTSIAEILALTPKEFDKKLNALEKEMFHAASNLEFEKAARIRDEIAEIKRVFMMG